MTRPNNQTTVIVAHQFETLEQQFDADLLGMWLFLVTEALLFSGAFLALAVRCRRRWGGPFAPSLSALLPCGPLTTQPGTNAPREGSPPFSPFFWWPRLRT